MSPCIAGLTSISRAISRSQLRSSSVGSVPDGRADILTSKARIGVEQILLPRTFRELPQNQFNGNTSPFDYRLAPLYIRVNLDSIESLQIIVTVPVLLDLLLCHSRAWLPRDESRSFPTSSSGIRDSSRAPDTRGNDRKFDRADVRVTILCRTQ